MERRVDLEGHVLHTHTHVLCLVYMMHQVAAQTMLLCILCVM